MPLVVAHFAPPANFAKNTLQSQRHSRRIYSRGRANLKVAQSFHRAALDTSRLGKYSGTRQHSCNRSRLAVTNAPLFVSAPPLIDWRGDRLSRGFQCHLRRQIRRRLSDRRRGDSFQCSRGVWVVSGALPDPLGRGIDRSAFSIISRNGFIISISMGKTIVEFCSARFRSTSGGNEAASPPQCFRGSWRR